MTIQAVLLPLLVEVALTFVLLFRMGVARQAGTVKMRDIAAREPGWPDPIVQVGNGYLYRLELPVLFYLLTILAVMTRHADLLFVVLAWVFVSLRIVHASVHIGSNEVARRFMAFGAGAVVLLIMWVIFAARILLALP